MSKGQFGEPRALMFVKNPQRQHERRHAIIRTSDGRELLVVLDVGPEAEEWLNRSISCVNDMDGCVPGKLAKLLLIVKEASGWLHCTGCAINGTGSECDCGRDELRAKLRACAPFLFEEKLVTSEGDVP